MTRTRVLAPAVTVLILLSGCGSESSSTSSQGPADPSTSATTAASDASPLEGTWTTDLTPEAVRAYIRRQGWSKQVERAIMQPDMAAPPTTEFRIDFEDDFFRLALVATDEQWESGTYRVEDGRVYLDDEAPVGEGTFRYHVKGNTVTFDDPGDTSDPDNQQEWVDGAPIWAMGGVLLGSTPWERSSGS